MRPYLLIFVIEAFGGSLLFIYGLTHSTLAVSAALSSLAPVISVPIAWGRRTEPVSWTKALGICLAVAGTVILLTA
jgi:drug/metabolite transporter (DMT)-like permease